MNDSFVANVASRAPRAFAILGILCMPACAASQEPAASPEPASPGVNEASAQAVSDPSSSGAVAASGDATQAAAAGAPRHLEASIEPRSGSTLVGKAELTEVVNGVKVVVRLDLAEPGLHGVHIHEHADCSAPDASSAGDHFNPQNHPHALPTQQRRHLGDLGNMGAIAPEGRGALEIIVEGATLEPGAPHSFVGRALVVHENEDTGEQPSGNSGKRVGCAELK